MIDIFITMPSELLVNFFMIFLALAVGVEGVALNYSLHKTIYNHYSVNRAAYAPDYSLAIFYQIQMGQ